MPGMNSSVGYFGASELTTQMLDRCSCEGRCVDDRACFDLSRIKHKKARTWTRAVGFCTVSAMRKELIPTIRAEFDRLRIVLVRTRNPLNIGAVARAMSNFGFTHLGLVNPYGPAFREARSAVGAAEVLETAEEYGSLAEAVGGCALVVGTTAVGKRSIKHAVARLEQGADKLRKGLATGNVSLLFGSERTGLSNKDFSYCHWLMRIPTCDANISMNLGQAVAVCLYEIARDAAAAQQPEAQSASPSKLIEQLTNVLFEALRASGYLKSETSAYMEAKIRRRVRRLKLSTVDAEACIGMLRQMIWKMRRM